MDQVEDHKEAALVVIEVDLVEEEVDLVEEEVDQEVDSEEEEVEEVDLVEDDSINFVYFTLIFLYLFIFSKYINL